MEFENISKRGSQLTRAQTALSRHAGSGIVAKRKFRAISNNNLGKARLSIETIKIESPIEETLLVVAQALNKRVQDVVVTMLDRPRHHEMVAEIRGVGASLRLISDGDIAAATSTGGISGKLPGRIGDSAIIGAGLFGDARGGASATGTGEAILRMGLCREAVLALEHEAPTKVAERAIARLAEETNAQAGIVLVDSSGRIGYAHNAQAMQIAIFDSQGLRHFAVEPRTSGRTRLNSARE